LAIGAMAVTRVPSGRRQVFRGDSVVTGGIGGRWRRGRTAQQAVVRRGLGGGRRAHQFGRLGGAVAGFGAAGGASTGSRAPQPAIIRTLAAQPASAAERTLLCNIGSPDPMSELSAKQPRGVQARENHVVATKSKRLTRIHEPVSSLARTFDAS
jgi:hypothetical protein